MKKLTSFLVALMAIMLCGCDTVDNKVLPSYTVRIDLGSYALWNTYGVNGVGDYQIFNRAKQLPRNFAYNANTYTGFGGVLLMMALDVSTGTYAPVAYDAACPEEKNMDVVVSIDPTNFEAVCPKCGSRFNVLTGSGGPVAGRALTHKLGLTTYKCRASQNGGYIVTSY